MSSLQAFLIGLIASAFLVLLFRVKSFQLAFEFLWIVICSVILLCFAAIELGLALVIVTLLKIAVSFKRFIEKVPVWTIPLFSLGDEKLSNRLSALFSIAYKSRGTQLLRDRAQPGRFVHLRWADAADACLSIPQDGPVTWDPARAEVVREFVQFPSHIAISIPWGGDVQTREDIRRDGTRYVIDYKRDGSLDLVVIP